MENETKPLLPSALGVLTHVPKKIDQIEDFVKSMYRVDKHIDMKTIYKSPLDIARLHVIEDDYRRHGLTRSANVLKVFLEILRRMPTAIIAAVSELPPWDIKGRVNPVTGNNPTAISIFNSA